MTDLDDLGTTPAPAPPPRPVPTPAPVPRPDAEERRVWLYSVIGGVLLWVATVVGLVYWLRHEAPAPTPGPTPAPVVDGVKLGREFVQPLANALADGFDADADALEARKSVEDADKALKEAFQKSRGAEFLKRAGPTFEAVVPAGTEPKDDAKREAFVKLHRDFAKGLRGGR